MSLPRIAINGRFLTQRASGVQRFAMEAIKAIDALLDGDYAALKGRIEILAPRNARDFPLKNIPLRRVGYSSGYAWEQFEFPLNAAGHLLLNLCMLGPLMTKHQLVVVHAAAHLLLLQAPVGTQGVGRPRRLRRGLVRRWRCRFGVACCHAVYAAALSAILP